MQICPNFVLMSEIQDVGLERRVGTIRGIIEKILFSRKLIALICLRQLEVLFNIFDMLLKL